MTIKRGKRRSVIVETRWWRLRIVPGRFQWHWERERRYGAWTVLLSLKLLLVTFYQKTHA